MTPVPDALVDAARAGDPAALAELMRVQRTAVVRYALRLCISPEDAEDATQEALLALARYIGSLREVAALSSWLFRAVRTHCTRLARRSLRAALVDDVDSLESTLASTAESPEDLLVDEQLRLRLSEVLSEMAPTLREVLVRRDVLGESANDVAQTLGLTIEATKSRLHRARAEAKERLLRSIRQKSASRTSLSIS